MEFRIAHTLTDSLARLTGDEQKAVKTTVFDLHVDPVNPGMQLHELDRARDPKCVEEEQLAALITALHRAAQRQLPVVLVGAGLPQLRGRMGRAKSYRATSGRWPS